MFPQGPGLRISILCLRRPSSGTHWSICSTKMTEHLLSDRSALGAVSSMPQPSSQDSLPSPQRGGWSAHVWPRAAHCPLLRSGLNVIQDLDVKRALHPQPRAVGEAQHPQRTGRFIPRVAVVAGREQVTLASPSPGAPPVKWGSWRSLLLSVWIGNALQRGHPLWQWHLNEQDCSLTKDFPCQKSLHFPV